MEDPKKIVEEGYDRIARRYLETFDADPSTTRMWFLAEVLRRVPEGADVLELGCGSGIPVAKALVEGGRRYTGVDISSAQLALAREHVPAGTFAKSDFTSMEQPDGSLDAVVSFYAFNHVPPAEQAPTIERAFAWLRPGGRFCATLTGGGDAFEDVEEDWLGVPMYFAGIPFEDDERILREAGFELELSEVREEVEHDGQSVSFHWAIARKPG